MLPYSEISLWLLLLAASATDLLWGKIYNWMTLPFFFAGILFRYYYGGWEFCSEAFLAIGLACVVFFPLYFFNAIAAGDVKLMLAIAAWSVSIDVIHISLFSVLMAAFVGLLVLIQEKKWKVKDFLAEKTHMAFAPSFFCAYLILKIAEMKRWL